MLKNKTWHNKPFTNPKGKNTYTHISVHSLTFLLTLQAYTIFQTHKTKLIQIKS